MPFTQAGPEHLDHVTVLLLDAKIALDALGILQWTDAYPSRRFVEASIEAGELYVLTVDGAVVGSVVLNSREDLEWRGIPWQATERPALVIHALAITPAAQGQRYGDTLLQMCEQHARDLGYGSIRIDVCATNPIALGFYQRRGYQHRGDVHFSFKPAGHQRYACYEKAL